MFRERPVGLESKKSSLSDTNHLKTRTDDLWLLFRLDFGFPLSCKSIVFSYKDFFLVEVVAYLINDQNLFRNAYNGLGFLFLIYAFLRDLQS